MALQVFISKHLLTLKRYAQAVQKTDFWGDSGGRTSDLGQIICLLYIY